MPTQTFDPYQFVNPSNPMLGGTGIPVGQPPIPGLPDFIDCVEILLDRITGSWKEILIPYQRRKLLRDAFEDLVTRRVFKDTHDALVDPNNQQKLMQAGLTGIQLKLKLEQFQEAWSKFWSIGSRGWLERLLNLINKILKSVASAIPGAEAIMELKDACEEEMTDTA